MPDLTALTQHHLAEARDAERGRSVALVAHDGPLRQSLIALTAGSELAEHNSPPAATLQVLVGRIRVTGMADSEVAAGELTVVTQDRHAVQALEDSVFLLTTVTGVPSAEGA